MQKLSLALIAAVASANLDHDKDGKEWQSLSLKSSEQRHFARVPVHDSELEVPIHRRKTADHGSHGYYGEHHQDYYQDYQLHKTDPFRRLSPEHEEVRNFDHHVDYSKHYERRYNPEQQWTDSHEGEYMYERPRGEWRDDQHQERAQHDSEYLLKFDNVDQGTRYHHLETDSNYQPPPPVRDEDEPKPAAPVTEQVSPVTEPAAPVTEQVSPVTEPAAPVTEQVSPVTEPAAPVTKPVAPVTEQVSPVTEPVAPVTEPVVTPVPAPSPTPSPTPVIEPSAPKRTEPAPVKKIITPAAPPKKEMAETLTAPTQPPKQEEATKPTEPTEPSPAASTKKTKTKKAKAFAEKAMGFIDQEIQDGDLEKFAKYCSQFGKSYVNQTDFKLRLKNWKQADKFIQTNSWDAGRHFELAHNMFSDWTDVEYEKLLGYAAPAEKKTKNYARASNTAEAADSIDWTELGMVSPVSNQLTCGSDWAISAIGAVEGAYGIQTGNFVALSGQQLLDCSGKATSCKGGTVTIAFDYLETSKAMAATDYPHYAIKVDCLYDETKATSAKVKSYNSAQVGDIKMMKLALTHQPISAVINASAVSFQLYSSGILDDATCTGVPNHAVVVTGYGTFEGSEYWIVKNSFGENWGERGYIRVAMNPGDGICSIQTGAIWPVLQ